MDCIYISDYVPAGFDPLNWVELTQAQAQAKLRQGSGLVVTFFKSEKLAEKASKALDFFIPIGDDAYTAPYPEDSLLYIKEEDDKLVFFWVKPY